MLLAFALLTALLIVEAVQQGILVWVLREFVPEQYQGKRLATYTSFALHTLGVIAHLLTAVYVAGVCGIVFSISFWVFVILLRVVIFDVVINATRNYMNKLYGRGREETFYVGTQSFTDKIIRWIGGKLKVKPSIVSVSLRLVSVLWIFYYLFTQ